MTRRLENHASARGAVFQAPLVAPQPTVERPSPLHLVGNTPLIRLARIPEIPPEVEIYAKAEWHNPGGSVKARAALAMVEEIRAINRERVASNELPVGHPNR